MGQRLNILVAPLNWGLGHASRCVPVIRELIAQEVNVVLGAEEFPLGLLRAEFPDLPYVELPGYNVTYPSGGNMAVHMLKIMPKILKGIKKEHQVLQELIEERNLDGVISDNRFGLHTPLVPTVFMTHQIVIKSPYGESFIHKLNGRFINKFDHCWIPDHAGSENLSGDLAHKAAAPDHARFIGPLSRFRSGPENPDTYTYDVCALISGPEPQRTLFQHIVQTELELSNLRAAIVLGKAGMPYQETREKLDLFAHLPAEELENVIRASKIIVARAGYSTLMDLTTLGKRAILIPTPGQTEQEYLAEYHQEQKHFFCMEQDRFDLEEAMEYAEPYPGLHLPGSKDLLREAVADFLEAVRSHRSNPVKTSP